MLQIPLSNGCGHVDLDGTKTGTIVYIAWELKCHLNKINDIDGFSSQIAHL